MTVSDDNNSPEARAALRAAAAVVPTFPEDPETCQHPEPTEVGRGFEEDVHTSTCFRCLLCGTEFVQEVRP